MVDITFELVFIFLPCCQSLTFICISTIWNSIAVDKWFSMHTDMFENVQILGVNQAVVYFPAF